MISEWSWDSQNPHECQVGVEAYLWFTPGGGGSSPVIHTRWGVAAHLWFTPGGGGSPPIITSSDWRRESSVWVTKVARMSSSGFDQENLLHCVRWKTDLEWFLTLTFGLRKHAGFGGVLCIYMPVYTKNGKRKTEVWKFEITQVNPFGMLTV